nr:DDE-type integrase/transposase/recombinase [Aminipila sp.]
MQYPGQKVYQYTAIDEFSRFHYVGAFNEHSTYSSACFLEDMLKAFPFHVECVQTNNELEFTNRFVYRTTDRPCLFEKTLAEKGTKHKKIRPFTPRHNGKVECSYRKIMSIFMQ